MGRNIFLKTLFHFFIWEICYFHQVPPGPEDRAAPSPVRRGGGGRHPRGGRGDGGGGGGRRHDEAQGQVIISFLNKNRLCSKTCGDKILK